MNEKKTRIPNRWAAEQVQAQETERAATLTHEMPHIVFHTSELRNRMSIAALGLRAADPADGKYGLMLPDQPTGVYVTTDPDEIGVWVGDNVAWGIWSITGADSLPHRQDPLNPASFVIESDVPRSMVAFHDIGSRISTAA